jgi:hypothetical protein
MRLRNLILPVALGFNAANAFGQAGKLTDAEIGNAGPSKLIFATATNAGCDSAKALAEKDIANNLPFLCLSGGIAPMVFVPTDYQFEQKFQVHYYEFGCSPAENACMVSYNSRIFTYLSDKYGNQWLKLVRKDAVGLKEWKKSR